MLAMLILEEARNSYSTAAIPSNSDRAHEPGRNSQQSRYAAVNDRHVVLNDTTVLPVIVPQQWHSDTTKT